ncbi:late control protein D [Parasedimentitalea maritima]|uniref:Late control protein D n=2 Tax=Parasedimentitalea TaxID=2738399 RepID=A0ABY2UWT1_9RHOB|nr:contractile injection system protein, VgrG/Pvc8 family [Zongyanglinia marina]TLP67075.1 late control protein D [Zongyanglinia marina]
MGLMDFLPFFRITVDGTDISGVLAPRLVSLTLTDAAGVQSDNVQITLSDTTLFGRLVEPRAGAEIRVWLGYPLQLKYMGMFTADSVEVEGPPDRMMITGLATINGETTSGKTALTDQKKRSWPEGTSIGALVEKIAGEHDMEPAVSQSLADLALPHIDQIDESDMNLLSRVARDFDAIAKPGDGRIVMAKRGESLTASGQPMPTLLLTQKKVSRWRYRNSVKAKAGSVVAVYQDLARGKPEERTAGEGEPVRRLKRRFPNKDAAQTAADSEFQKLQRAGRSLLITMPGDPDAMAEGKLLAAGFRSYIDGEWLITRATHNLDSGGYRTSIESEPME